MIETVATTFRQKNPTQLKNYVFYETPYRFGQNSTCTL